jgi:predicted nuclease with TOPRIM domain
VVEEEKKNEYNLEEVVEYQELLEKCSNLEGKINELNETINNFNAQVSELNNIIVTLTEENKNLAEFKHTIDREKKKDLINSFYMLSDELKKDCFDNIDTYSYDEIEAKLSVICVRNKVSFDLDKPEEKNEMVFNLNSIEDDESFGLPAWVQRVQEVAKEKNI